MLVDRCMERVAALASALTTIRVLVMVGVVGSITSLGVLGALVGVRDASADSFTTGNVRGQVKDQATGQAAISATVVATSASLQGEQVVIADESGGYYLTALPPGIYTLTVYTPTPSSRARTCSSRSARRPWSTSRSTATRARAARC
jgi:hypothetical protein